MNKAVDINMFVCMLRPWNLNNTKIAKYNFKYLSWLNCSFCSLDISICSFCLKSDFMWTVLTLQYLGKSVPCVALGSGVCLYVVVVFFFLFTAAVCFVAVFTAVPEKAIFIELQVSIFVPEAATRSTWRTQNTETLEIIIEICETLNTLEH